MNAKSKKKILLIENNVFFSSKITDQLKRLGHSVDVRSGSEGGKVKMDEGTSLVIIDLAAKNINVLEIIKNLKNSSETASILLLGFAGHREQRLFESARSYGCDRVVTNNAVMSDIAGVLEEIE